MVPASALWGRRWRALGLEAVTERGLFPGPLWCPASRTKGFLLGRERCLQSKALGTLDSISLLRETVTSRFPQLLWEIGEEGGRGCPHHCRQFFLLEKKGEGEPTAQGKRSLFCLETFGSQARLPEPTNTPAPFRLRTWIQNGFLETGPRESG